MSTRPTYLLNDVDAATAAGLLADYAQICRALDAIAGRRVENPHLLLRVGDELIELSHAVATTALRAQARRLADFLRRIGVEVPR